jgi:hypothetical protein
LAVAASGHAIAGALQQLRYWLARKLVINNVRRMVGLDRVQLALTGAAIGTVAALLAGLLATRRVLDAPPSVTLRELQE